MVNNADPLPYFWGWTPFYNLFDKTFQSMEDAQLQTTDFDVFGEIHVDDIPATARWIQDNDDNNHLAPNGNVYQEICNRMQMHGLVGPNKECLAMYSAQVYQSPRVAPGEETTKLPNCTYAYGTSPGDNAMLHHEQELMHAFAGDYFGTLWAYHPFTFPDETPETKLGPPCSYTLTETDIQNKIGFPGFTTSATTLAAPDQITVKPPPVLNLHVSTMNAYPSTNPFTADSTISKLFFNYVYNMVTTPRSTIRNGVPAFTMPLTATAPVVIGDTFSTQTIVRCPQIDPFHEDLTNGAEKEVEGFKLSDLYLAHTIFDTNGFGEKVVLRPVHWQLSTCPTPSQLAPPTTGPYGTYKNK
jgi:hypothetical protein